MARPHLLLVDADPRTIRVLEVNLKNDGFSVTTATDGAEAISKLEFALPDVLVAETRLPRADGFEVVRRLRSLPGGELVPVVLVAPEAGGRGPGGLSLAETDQLRAVELGIADCLRKPVSVRELVTRVNLMLARRTQILLASSSSDQSHFSGHLQDIGVIDLLQAFESGRRSGVLQIEHGARSATVLFKSGKVIDAEQGQLRGEEALYRTFLWTTGVFDVDFTAVEAPDNIPISTAALIMEGMRRIDEWGRLAEQLPSSASVFAVDAEVLLSRLAEVPDELNPVLRLFDGRRSLMAVIDESPFDDLSTLEVVSKLFFEGVLRVVEAPPASLLASARALGSGSNKAGGNVIRLPHVGESPVAIGVRPHAPAMSQESAPRSLVYSEPPQSLRLSQRAPGGVAVTTSTLPRTTPEAATPSALTSGAPTVPMPKAAKVERSGDEVRAPVRVVSEAEFEDLKEPEAVPPAPTPSASVAAAQGFAADSAKPSHGAVIENDDPEKADRLKDHIEHDDFFAVGDEGSYDGGPSSLHPRDDAERMHPGADVDLDPQVLASLHARREQGKRWATWVFGAALLVLLWGVVSVVNRDQEDQELADAEPERVTLGASSAATGVPVANPASNEVASQPTAATPAETTVFEDVSLPAAPANFSSAPKGFTPAQGAGLTPMEPPSPRGAAGRGGKKPPTARFPSTPEAQ